MQNKKWVWEDDRFPSFPYDKKEIEVLLRDVSRNMGRLEGVLNALGERSVREINIESSIEEIISSSEIEGEILKRDSVRSSVRKRLDSTFTYAEDRSTRHTDGLVDVFTDSSTNRKPITIERLNGWHNALFPTGYSGMLKIDTACFRKGSIEVVSGHVGKEKVKFVAPPAENVNKQMKAFLKYVNDSNDDPYIKSAIVHLWFVIIHPYDDGNGRLTRAITNYVLSEDSELSFKYFSISGAIKNDRKGYYSTMEKTNNLIYNRKFDFTNWIKWHTEMINNAIKISLNHIQASIDQTKFWDRVRYDALSPEQLKVIGKMVEKGIDGFQGGLTNKKYCSIAKTSPATATRHIKELLAKRVLCELDGYSGRNTRYDILWEIPDGEDNTIIPYINISKKNQIAITNVLRNEDISINGIGEINQHNENFKIVGYELMLKEGIEVKLDDFISHSDEGDVFIDEIKSSGALKYKKMTLHEKENRYPKTTQTLKYTPKP